MFFFSVLFLCWSSRHSLLPRRYCTCPQSQDVNSRQEVGQAVWEVHEQHFPRIGTLCAEKKELTES